MRRLVALATILLLGCGGGGSNCTVATEGCECTPGGLCDSPNTCVSGICVPPAADTSTDTVVDTVADTAADDYVGEIECSADPDCDDSNPCTVDACDLDYNTCSHEPFDGDGDGFPAIEVDGTGCGGTDCDDEDPLTGEQQCEGVNPCCDGCNRQGCWRDPTTGLLWEDPPMSGSLDWDEAFAYCNTLSLAGRGAGWWMLPPLNALRSLVRGCPDTEDGGACGVTESCFTYDCWTSPACEGCGFMEGPGTGGCYWDPALEGSCGKVWAIPNCGGYAWLVDFSSGWLEHQFDSSANPTRCVSSP